jgi:RimJ/RimL family protein N-acetyltransferase
MSALSETRSTVSIMSQFDPMPDSLMTERLRLRPWTEADAPQYRALWLGRDPRSVRVISAAGRPTVEDLRASIRSQLASTALTDFGLMVVERRAEKDFIGYCGLIGRDATPEEPEVAYELLRAAHGRGYATEAVRAVQDAAAAAGRSRLWAGVRVWNIASLRVLNKLGFVSSGQVSEDLERGDMVLMTCRLEQPS